MNKRLVVSFILPCYNVEKQIDHCLNSIYLQDVAEDLFEVICVNDCSTDETSRRISEYRLQHSNLLMLEHIQNQGPGVTRNTGFCAANADFVWFVDADDNIQHGVLSEIVKDLQRINPEIYQFNANVVNQNGKLLGTVYDRSLFVNERVAMGPNLLVEFGLNSIPFYEWSRIYRRNYLIEKAITFPMLSYGEDVIHSIQAFLCAKQVYLKNAVYYNYCTNEDSLTNTSLYTANKNFQNIVVLGFKLIEFGKLYPSEAGDMLIEGGKWRVNQFVKPLLKMKHSERIRFFSLVLNHQDLSSHAGYFSKFNYFMLHHARISLVFFYLTSLVYQIIHAIKGFFLKT